MNTFFARTKGKKSRITEEESTYVTVMSVRAPGGLQCSSAKY